MKDRKVITIQDPKKIRFFKQRVGKQRDMQDNASLQAPIPKGKGVCLYHLKVIEGRMDAFYQRKDQDIVNLGFKFRNAMKVGNLLE